MLGSKSVEKYITQAASARTAGFEWGTIVYTPGGGESFSSKSEVVSDNMPLHIPLLIQITGEPSHEPITSDVLCCSFA